MRNFVLLALSLLAVSARAGTRAFFPMGVWYEGGVGELRDNLIPADPAKAALQYRRDFRDIAAHGVNCAVVPNTPPEHHRALLDAARKAGLRLIIELDVSGGELGAMVRGAQPLDSEAIRKTLDAKLKPILRHPALWRVQLLDEPSVDGFGRYGRVAQALRAYAPGVEPFCCLIGSGDFAGFLSATGSNVAAFDCYPIGTGNREGDAGPLKAFEAQAASAGLACYKANADAYAVIQCHAITGVHRFPTPAELRCMTYSALATGSKGVFWFLYQTEWWNKEKGETMDGLVDTNYRPRPLWGEVASLTKAIRRLAPTLQTLHPDTTPGLVESDASAHLLRDISGRAFVFVVNLDTLGERKVTTRFRLGSDDGGVTRVGAKGRLTAHVADGWLSWSETLPPGGGALYRVR